MFIPASTFKPDARAVGVRVHPAYPGLCLRGITSADHFRKVEGLMFFASNGKQEAAFGFYGLSYREFLSRKGYPVFRSGSQVIAHGNYNNAFQVYTSGGSGALMGPVALPSTASGNSMYIPDVKFIPADVQWDEALGYVVCTLGGQAFYAMEIVAFGADNGQFLYTGFRGLQATGDSGFFSAGVNALEEFVTNPNVFQQPTTGPFAGTPPPDIALGWLSSFASVGTRRAGVESKWAEVMASADSEVRKYLDRAKAAYVAAPASQRSTGVNIVTTWRWRTEAKRFSCDFGFPSVLTSGRVDMYATSAAPTAFTPSMCYPGGRPRSPELLLFTQPEVIRLGDRDQRVWSDLMAGHRLAEAMDYTSGKLLPGVAAGSDFSDAIRIVGEQFKAVANGFVPGTATIPGYVDTEGEGATTWATLSNYSGSQSVVYRGASEACGPQVLADMHDAFTSIYSLAEDMAKADAKRKSGF